MHPEFVPEVWPEQEAPPAAEHCRECELYTHRTRIVWGEGNPRAARWALLDNPGSREDRAGNPFVCGTRATLQFAAAHAGLTPDDLFVTYLLKRRPVKSYDKEQTRAACLGHLLEQLTEHAPKSVLCLGNIALKSFAGSPEADVKSMRGRWHRFRGIPVLATYHPLAVRRRPALMRIYLEDWLKFSAGPTV